MHHVDHPFGKADFIDNLKNPGLRHGNLFRWFQHIGIACDNGIGQKPPRHHGGKIVGRNCRKNTNGLAVAIAVNASSNILQGVAAHQGGHPGGVLDIFNHAAHFTPGLINGLALFRGQYPGNILKIFLKGLLQPEQIARPGKWRRASPAGKGGFGSLHRLVHIGSNAVRNPGDLFSFGRIPDIPKVC